MENFYHNFAYHVLLAKVNSIKQGRREEEGRGGAKYLEPGLVRGGDEILVKRLVMGATVKRVGGP